MRLIATAFLAVTLLSCGREPTGGRPDAVRHWNVGAVLLHFPPAYQQATSAGGIAPIERVRVLIRSPYGRAAVDTTFAFVDADSLVLPLRISLDIWWPDQLEPFALSLAFVDTKGDTVFRGGPITLRLAEGSNDPAGALTIPVVYTGVGAHARGVRISPRTLAVVAGDDFGFTAVATDSSGGSVSGTPVVWTTLDPSRATLSSPARGQGIAVGASGTAQIVGRLLSGPADTVMLFIQPRPPTLTLVSGGGQVAAAHTRLPLPVVVRVASSDGTGRPGVAVSFTAANGGAVSAASVTTDASGAAQTLWTLGLVPGPQTMKVDAPGVTGSPLSLSATANAPPPDTTPGPKKPADSAPPLARRAATQLTFTESPSAVAAGIAIAPGVVVTALDDSGHVADDFRGTVSLSLVGALGASGVTGDRTVSAEAGVATFTAISVERIGGGFRFVATSGALRPDTSAAFAVVAGPAARMAIDQGDDQTGAVSTALATPLMAKVTDAFGNPVSLATVAFTVASGGGFLSVASVQTSAAGLVSATWTLGPAAGAQTAVGTVAGLAGSPVIWTATATGPATGPAPTSTVRLAFVQGPSTTVAGMKMTPSVVVHALRANGNHDPSFQGTITLALVANPGGAALSGGTSTAPAGSATFNGVSLDRAGTGYQMAASAPGVESATSGLFNIVAAGADGLELASGDGQDARVSSALPEPLTVRATDPLGNPVAGVTVTWVVTTGAGRLAAVTSATNDAGIASNTWTLGPSPGSQRVTASASGLSGSPVSFRANAKP